MVGGGAVDALLRLGANAGIRDNDCLTPAELAREREHLGLAEFTRKHERKKRQSYRGCRREGIESKLGEMIKELASVRSDFLSGNGDECKVYK
jgi:hypothetical protein